MGSSVDPRGVYARCAAVQILYVPAPGNIEGTKGVFLKKSENEQTAILI